MQTAQAVTPGQGQTVNVAGVEVGEIKSVELEDGRAIIGMKIEPRYDRVYRDATILLRPKTGLKDMVAELTPGTRGRRPAARGRADPGLADAARRQPRRDPRRARRRHARLPDAAAQRRRRGAARQRPRAGQHDPPDRADGEALAPGQRGARRAPANIKRAIHNFSLLTEELGDKDDTVADFVVDSNAVFASLRAARTRRCARRCASCRPRCRSRRPTLAQGGGAGRRARADAARRCGRPPARSGRPSASCGRSCARRRRSSATSCARSRARRCRPSRSCARRCATSRPPPRTSRRPSRASTACSTCSPTTRRARRRRATCSGSPGPTTWRRRLRHPGRARPDPPRPRGLRLPDRRAAGRGRGGQPAARHARRPAQRARTAPALCPSSSQEPGAGGG